MKNNVPVELRVSGATHPTKLGGAIAKYMGEVDKVVLTAMGNAAVNQAVKGIIVAQSYLASNAKRLDIQMGFCNKDDADQQGREITLIEFHLQLA